MADREHSEDSAFDGRAPCEKQGQKQKVEAACERSSERGERTDETTVLREGNSSFGPSGNALCQDKKHMQVLIPN